MKIHPKKYFGQHFLKDTTLAKKIVDLLSDSIQNILEIGPGIGALMYFLIQSKKNFQVCEIDKKLVQYLKDKFPSISDRIIEYDFLRLDLTSIFIDHFAIIGNFPYNISSQILFKILDSYQIIPEVVGMFQQEVAKRIVAIHGTKEYGILSILVQFYYKTEYLFTIQEDVFSPPPRVKSAIIKMNRLKKPKIQNKKLAFLIIKTAFNQRRKILKNSLKNLIMPKILKSHDFLKLRAEQLSVDDFVKFINIWEHEKF